MDVVKVVGLTLCTLAFVFSIVSITTGNWLVGYRESGEWVGAGGLFYACDYVKCVYSAGKILYSHELKTSLALFLISIIGFFVCNVLICIGMFKKCCKCFRFGGVLAVIAAVIQIAAMIFFTTQQFTGVQGFSFKLGYSFALGWVVAVLGIVGGIFTLAETEDGKVKLMGRFRILSTSQSSSVEKV